MADWNSGPIEPRGYAGVVSVDNVLTRVFGWMAMGLGLTALVAFAVASNQSAISWLLQNQWSMWVLMIAELGLVIGLSAAINRISTAAAAFMFFLYAALNGVTLSFILLVYTASSVGTAFLTTGATFGVMAVFGATTKRDLTGMGQFMFMGLVGIVIASLVNLFLHNSAMELVISCIGVIVFTGLTAFHVQKIRSLALQHSGEGLARISILSALMLYLDFINLFLSVLRLTGNRR